MNEQLKQLMLKSGTNKYISEDCQHRIEFLYELIVKECAGVAEISMPANSNPDDVLKVKNNILEHFGIK